MRAVFIGTCVLTAAGAALVWSVHTRLRAEPPKA
jgi:hypothetical protein